MNTRNQAVLDALSGTRTVDDICHALAISEDELLQWTREECASRRLSVNEVDIPRDARGIPHIFADSVHDLFFTCGYAMAQHRLWQLDYLRRAALGTLSEIMGASSLESDVQSRTLRLPQLAEQQAQSLDDETREILEAFTAGVNAWTQGCREAGRLPIEFDVLGYQPDLWSPRDTLAILRNFWWQLTGRLFYICGSELVKRALNDERLFRLFLTPEGLDESILLLENLGTAKREDCHSERSEESRRYEILRCAQNDNIGSNNWLVAGSKSVTGLPLLASDPHLPFLNPSVWWEAHLCGAGFNVAGAILPGVPGVGIGRNERVAWGVTNNICSLRDLYVEKIDRDHPNRYQRGGQWKEMATIVEQIKVKGQEAHRLEIKMTDHGPVANRILPEPARSTHEVISLRWVGLELSDELRALLKLNRARTVNEARDALRNWHCPTWNFIIADADGHVGYQCVGSIPVRTRNERGYRKGWDAEDEWQGFIPYDELPALRDPPRGWIASANNRVAPDEFPHFLSGFWTGSHRMERCREMLMEQEKFSVDDFKRMHFDTVSKRAEGLMPHLLAVIKGEPQFAAVIERLRKTDFRYDEDSVAATMFETFFIEWEKTVLRERLPLETHALLLPQSAMLANQLLKADEFGWFKNGDREQKIREAFAAAMAWLSSRVSPNPSTWRWDKVHTVTFKHPLALNDFAARVFNVGPFPHHGSPTSVNNAGYDPQNPFHTTSGVSYRLIADLSTQELWGINTTGQSGNPASPHYCDQTEDWRTGKYHAIPLRRDNGVME